MKNQFIRFIVVAFVVVLGFSCSDDDSNISSLSGKWSYTDPYMVFDYEKPTVDFTMGSAGSRSFTPKQVIDYYMVFGGEKMKNYFTGVNFRADNQLMIYMKKANNVQDSLKARYRLSGDLVGISIDTADLRRVSGMRIPPLEISFHYSQSGDNMMLYIGKEYLELLVRTQMDMILNMALPQFIPNYDRIPPVGQAAMKASFKNQINVILENTTRLEVGVQFKLVR